MTPPPERRAAKGIRIAAVGDMHCTRNSLGAFQGLFAQIAASADILLLCGDLTACGLPEEARILARELTVAAKMPIVSVLGNHEYESGKQDEVRQILLDAGARVLDGEACEISGVGFAGVKGFGGGFDRRSLEPWGEPTMKQFVHEAVDEALKLGSALARLRTAHRIAILHYSPVRTTVVGEPLEIFPFLGSSRLEEPLNRYPLAAVFHGHAHNGQLEGRTTAGVPRRNRPRTSAIRMPTGSTRTCSRRSNAPACPFSSAAPTRWTATRESPASRRTSTSSRCPRIAIASSICSAVPAIALRSPSRTGSRRPTTTTPSWT